ncbi:MAG: glucose-1-phosphate adenylyltransferase, partial [Clostridiales bacterium]|nr:glucose-1-phosphate adenylyltransferase [Clostridiales bacterium]
YHKAHNADATIAVIDVPLDQASRFGIMNTHEDGKIYEFEEKPAKPKSTHASMGIYIFNKRKLFDYLIADDADPDSAKDFGKNIIPKMLGAGEVMYAYPFSGYWKDVGTLQSLWEANMDLLGDNPQFDLTDRSWRIFSRNYALPPHYIGDGAKVKNSIITEGCRIYGTVINSVLSKSVYVAPGAVVRDSVIMSGTQVKAGADVEYSIVDSDCDIGCGCVVGEPKTDGAKITLVGSENALPDGLKIEPGSMINADKLRELTEAQ